MSSSSNMELQEYLEEKELVNFNPAKLPSLISNQVNKIKELREEIDKASKHADKAKEKARDASKKSAKRGFFKDKKKEAIEELQSAGKSMATAVESNSRVQTLSFEFQEELAKISKNLFMLGLSNTVNNRIVVRELELKLKDASQEEISELARKELMLVVKKLKEQQDLEKKQEKIKTKLRKQHEKLDRTIKKQDEHEKELLAQAENDKRHEKKLKKLAETDKHHDAEFEIRAEMDRIHDAKLEERAEIDKRHDEQIENIQKQLNDLNSVSLIAKIALLLALSSLIIMFVYIF